MIPPNGMKPDIRYTWNLVGLAKLGLSGVDIEISAGNKISRRTQKARKNRLCEHILRDRGLDADSD